MMHSTQISNILIVISILAVGILFFTEVAITGRLEIITLGYHASFLILLTGYILRKKNVQQLIGLFFYLICFNLDLLKSNLFQIPNNDILHFAKLNSFYAIVIASVFILPTLFDKYELAPLANRINIKDTTIILAAITMTVIIQTAIRFTT